MVIFGKQIIMEKRRNQGDWVLYSPFAPPDLEPRELSNYVMPEFPDFAMSTWHQEGYFLSAASFDGWRFGLLQPALHRAGIQGFLRSPEGAEATIVSDPHAPVLERLAVAGEGSYVGAFRIRLPLPLDSLENIVDGFRQALPLLKEQFKKGLD